MNTSYCRRLREKRRRNSATAPRYRREFTRAVYSEINIAHNRSPVPDAMLPRGLKPMGESGFCCDSCHESPSHKESPRIAIQFKRLIVLRSGSRAAMMLARPWRRRRRYLQWNSRRWRVAPIGGTALHGHMDHSQAPIEELFINTRGVSEERSPGWNGRVPWRRHHVADLSRAVSRAVVAVKVS
jgi:hypothetical protein